MTEFKVEDLAVAAKALRAGEQISLTGTIYTARDAAHKRLFELLDRGEPLPFELAGAVIYYAGPTPAPNGKIIGSCGPTTSVRMDSFTPRLLNLGLIAMIGKGERTAAVCDAIAENGAVYFCAIGGAGALIASHVTSVKEIAFPELGCESIKRLTVEKMPLTVGVDCHGGNIFADGRARYLAKVGEA